MKIFMFVSYRIFTLNVVDMGDNGIKPQITKVTHLSPGGSEIILIVSTVGLLGS